MIRAPRARPGQPRRRGRVERRLPPAALPAEGHPGARHRAGAERRGRGRRARGADGDGVLRRRAWPALARRARAGADLVLGNNVLAQVPDINDFVAGVALLLAPGGIGDVRVPAPRATAGRASEYDTIYHEHFSYFSLHSIRSIFGAHGLARRRRGGAPEPRRVASGLLRARRPRRRAEPRRHRAPRPRGRRRGFATRRRTTGSRSACSESKRALLELLIGLRRDGQAGRRLRRAGQGQHASQLLRDPHGLPRVHGRPEPVQAGQVHAGNAHPDPSRPSGSPRPSRTSS